MQQLDGRRAATSYAFELARYLDLANHHANATPADIRSLCRKVAKYRFHTAFVNPDHVPLARSILKGKAAVGTVVSFPLGQDFLEDKIAAAKHAVKAGADELDICMNIGRFKSGDTAYTKRELGALVKAAKASRKDIIVKFIIETGYLTDAEIRKASKIVLASGADFIKTDSGVGPRGASVKDILLIRKAVGSKIKVKAAGGITNYRQAMRLIRAGADRIGTSHAVEIVRGVAGRRPGRGE
jgi:deoxyribose-phosphate aldolase